MRDNLRKKCKELVDNKDDCKTFALMGVAGYIAPRHLEAIHENGGNLIAAMDPNDSVGLLDRYFPSAQFFVSPERFERFVNKQKEAGNTIKYITICSPNFLHDTHCRFALQNGADAICEKPLVLTPKNLDLLYRTEQETGKKINCILQLRLHPKIIALREKVAKSRGKRFTVCLTYITSRGPWYDVSWKGDSKRSGGILFNIGVHFFDMLLDVFGPKTKSKLDYLTSDFAAGCLVCERADIEWKLSTNRNQLPAGCVNPTFREIIIDGEAFEFSEGFADLHTQSYRAILNGAGFGLGDVAPSISLISDLRQKQ